MPPSRRGYPWVRRTRSGAGCVPNDRSDAGDPGVASTRPLPRTRRGAGRRPGGAIPFADGIKRTGRDPSADSRPSEIPGEPGEHLHRAGPDPPARSREMPPTPQGPSQGTGQPTRQRGADRARRAPPGCRRISREHATLPGIPSGSPPGAPGGGDRGCTGARRRPGEAPIRCTARRRTSRRPPFQPGSIRGPVRTADTGPCWPSRTPAAACGGSRP